MGSGQPLLYRIELTSLAGARCVEFTPPCPTDAFWQRVRRIYSAAWQISLIHDLDNWVRHHGGGSCRIEGDEKPVHPDPSQSPVSDGPTSINPHRKHKCVNTYWAMCPALELAIMILEDAKNCFTDAGDELHRTHIFHWTMLCHKNGYDPVKRADARGWPFGLECANEEFD